MQTLKVALNKIELNRNSRAVYKETELAELMLSMKQDGQLQAVGVRKLANGMYDAIWGNRRILAAQKLGWDEIEANVMTDIDDISRDILNMVENIKRKNTTVAEDGCAFLRLQEAGLSKREIAVRLGISVLRVDTAIDIIQKFPKDFHAVIVNSGTGHTASRVGKISATAALNVNTLRKKFKLDKKQTTSLLNNMRSGQLNSSQTVEVGALLGIGQSIDKAISKASKTQSINLFVRIRSEAVAKLEKKYNKSIHNILYNYLESHKEFNCQRNKKITYHNYPANLSRRGQINAISRKSKKERKSRELQKS